MLQWLGFIYVWFSWNLLKIIRWYGKCQTNKVQSSSSQRTRTQSDLNPCSFHHEMRHARGRTQARTLAQKRGEKTTGGLVRPTNASSSTFSELHLLYPDRLAPANKQRWEFLHSDISFWFTIRASVQIGQSRKVMALVAVHSGHTLCKRMENQAGLRRRWCASQADLAEIGKAGGFRLTANPGPFVF